MSESRNDRSQTVTAYFADIQHYTPLSRQREAELAQRIRAGDEGALNELVTANLRFAIKTANEYTGRGLSLAELISEANWGLCQAAQRFDEKYGFRFVTYAVWWIRQAILVALAENSRIVRQPLSRYKDRRETEHMRVHMTQTLGSEPALETIAAQMHMSADRLRLAHESGQTDISMDAPLANNPDREIVTAFVSEEDDAEELFEKLERSGRLTECLNSLDGREAWILRMLFGLDGCRPMTLQATGDQLGLTRERVRQLRNKALARLRKLHGTRLRELC